MASGNGTVIVKAKLRDHFGQLLADISFSIEHDLFFGEIDDSELKDTLIKNLEGKYVQPKHVPNYIELEYVSG